MKNYFSVTNQSCDGENRVDSRTVINGTHTVNCIRTLYSDITKRWEG